jgi:O-antigen ligase
MLLIGAALLTVVTEGRFRKPDMTLGIAIVFTVLSWSSELWTVAPGPTSLAVQQYAQLLGSMWVVREIARSNKQQQSLMIAFCLGSLIPAIGVLNNYRIGIQIGDGRYSAVGWNADGIGLLGAINIPIAWYLLKTGNRSVRAIGLICSLIAPLMILLSGARSGFLSGVVGAAIVPLSAPRPSLRSVVRVTGLVLVVALLILLMVPGSTWDRLGTIPSEIMNGSMSARREIWQQGFDVFPQHPVLGIGAGAYGTLIHLRGFSRFFVPAHNVIVGLLVEQGIVGLSVFMGLLGACAWLIARLPKPERTLWAIVMLSWSVGILSGSLERWKGTWLLFGMLSAQSDLAQPFRIARRAIGTRSDALQVAWRAARPAPSRAQLVTGGRTRAIPLQEQRLK